MGNPDLIVIINKETFIIKGAIYDDKIDAVIIAIGKYNAKIAKEINAIKKINFPEEANRTNEQIQSEEANKMRNYYTDIEEIKVFEVNN